MMWDASQAYGMHRSQLLFYVDAHIYADLTANGRYDAAVKSALQGGTSAPTTPPPTSHSTTPTSSSPHTSSTPPPTTGNCAGVNAWVNNVAVSSEIRGYFASLTYIYLVQWRRRGRLRRTLMDS